jgi:hypothetical protein
MVIPGSMSSRGLMTPSSVWSPGSSAGPSLSAFGRRSGGARDGCASAPAHGASSAAITAIGSRRWPCFISPPCVAPRSPHASGVVLDERRAGSPGSRPGERPDRLAMPQENALNIDAVERKEGSHRMTESETMVQRRERRAGAARATDARPPRRGARP